LAESSPIIAGNFVANVGVYFLILDRGCHSSHYDSLNDFPSRLWDNTKESIEGTVVEGTQKSQAWESLHPDAMSGYFTHRPDNNKVIKKFKTRAPK